MKRPLILLTVYRRYVELTEALDAIQQAVARGEFRENPVVWIVWACPEVGPLWFFKELIEQGRAHLLLTRLRLPGEHAQGSTTYPESHNIRLGLDEAFRQFDDDETYVVVQAADVLPRHNIYRMLDDCVNTGFQAVVFHWENPVVHTDAWHTNFFVVPLNERYWPPVSPLDHADTLERQWGIKLKSEGLPGVFESSNYQAKRFLHSHRSDHLPPLQLIPLFGKTSTTLSITGTQSLWKRCIRFLKGKVHSWRLSVSRLTRKPKTSR